MQGYRPIVLYQATLLCKQACSFFFSRHAHSDFPPLFFLFLLFSLENLHAGLSPYSLVSNNTPLQASLLEVLLDTKLHGYFIAKRSQVQFLH
jgi:hypothetical protein